MNLDKRNAWISTKITCISIIELPNLLYQMNHHNNEENNINSNNN